jgi:hypothetical protein
MVSRLIEIKTKNDGRDHPANSKNYQMITKPAAAEGAEQHRAASRTAKMFQYLPIASMLIVVAALMIAGVVLAVQLIARGAAAAEPAQLGEMVELPGGLLRVDQVTPETMAPMHAGNFGKSGMNMSGMGVDMTPEGYRRFTVEFTVAAEARGGLQFAPEQFHVTGSGMEVATPLRSQLGDQFAPQGSAFTGSLVFQVPDKASNLVLSLDDSSQPISLDLPTADDHHDHDDGHDHEHGHDE